jgi:hypothetical protein
METFPVSKMSCFKYWTMEKVKKKKKLNDPNCYIPLSQPHRIQFNSVVSTTKVSNMVKEVILTYFKIGQVQQNKKTQ